MIRPFFSVVVTIYNKEKYLKACIDSILNQSFTNFELILINDGSSDLSASICDEYIMRDERIKVFHKKNEGLTKTRKAGIKNSTGEYIMFIDADDWIETEMLSNYAAQIKKNRADVVIGGMLKDFDTRIQKVANALPIGFYSKEDLQNKFIPKMIYTGNYYEKGIESYICARAVKREILNEIKDGISPEINFAEGGVWIYSAMLLAKTAEIIEDFSYHYRMHPDSMAMTDGEKVDVFPVYKTLINNIYRFADGNKQLLMQVDYLAFFFLIWKNPDLINFDKEHFYPYSMIKKNSRVVIYGAWRFGRELYKYMTQNRIGNIVLVVDKNADLYELEDYQISKPEEILNVEYDYIILGSEVYSVVCSMKKKLNEMGVYDKIVSITPDMIDMAKLPDKFKKYAKETQNKFGDK